MPMPLWIFRRRTGQQNAEGRSSIDERFTDMADRVSEAAGRWPASALSLVGLFAWIAAGPWAQWSDTWQLVANTPTTWIELFLGLFTLAAANRVEKRNYRLHIDNAQMLAKVEQLATTQAVMLAHLEALVEAEQVELRSIEDTLERSQPHGISGALQQPNRGAPDMPAWILSLIEDITPLTTVAEGLIKIGEAIAAEIKSGDNVEQKAAAVSADVSQAAHQISAALVSNTPHAGP